MFHRLARHFCSVDLGLTGAHLPLRRTRAAEVFVEPCLSIWRETQRDLYTVVTPVIAGMATSYESFRRARPVPTNRSPTLERCHMRKEYDFTAARKRPCAAQLKKQITNRLDDESIDCFKPISQDAGVLYQNRINLYLRDCAASHRKLNLNWS